MEAAAEELLIADALLGRAELLDPSWIDPILQRGWIAGDLARLRATSPSAYDRELIRSGLAHADRALVLAPSDAAALELRGALLYSAWEAAGAGQIAATLGEAEKDLLSAVESDPSRALAWATLSEIYRVRGLYGSALRAARKALEADAFLRDAAVVFFYVCQSYWEMEDLEKAMRCFAEGRQRFPTNAAYVAPELTYLASSTGPDPDLDEAWRLYDKLEELMGSDFADYRSSFLMMVAGALARAGKADSAYAVIRSARELLEPDDPWPAYFQANVHLNLGEPDSALVLLGQFLEAQPDYRSYIATDYWWRPLRDHPRFQGLLAKYQ